MTAQTLLRNAHIITPQNEWISGWLLINDGRIALIGPAEPPGFPAGSVDRVIDAAGKLLLIP